jgi:hypothetical protein
MHLLMTNLYEFGQFLQLALWIFIPLVLISLAVATWIHYRQKKRLNQPFMAELPPADGSQTGTNDLYMALLWMKDRFEGYRSLSDKKMERIKEELDSAKKKYRDLVERTSSRNFTHATAVTHPTDHLLTDTIPIKEHETTYWQEVLQQETAEEEEARLLLHVVREENQRLKEKVTAGQQFLNDLVAEKNKQIESLNGLLMATYKELDQTLRDKTVPDLSQASC